MPRPKDVHVNSALSNISVKYRNPGYIADKVFPVVKVNKRSDVYYVYNREDSFTVPDTKLAPSGFANEIDWGLSQDNYSVRDYALADFVDDTTVANADNPIRPLVDTTENLTDLMWLNYEKRVADIAFSAATYDANHKANLAGSEWDSLTGDPIKDIEEGMLKTQPVTPNTLVLGFRAWKALRRHPDILKAVKTSGQLGKDRGLARQEEVAELFGLKQVLVGMSQRNSAKLGQPATYEFIWNKDALLAFVPESPGIKQPTLGFTFEFMPREVQEIREEKRGLKGGTLVKVTHSSDEKLVAADVGYFLQNAAA